MSKGNTWENDLLKLVFNNVAAAGIGDAAGLLPSTAAGSLYISLHTADPGEAGDQTTSETAYTNYTRKAVTRDTAGFTVTANGVKLVNNLDFPECGATPGAAITHFAIGTAATLAGKILYKGTISPTITMATGVIPRITNTQDLVTEE